MTDVLEHSRQLIKTMGLVYVKKAWEIWDIPYSQEPLVPEVEVELEEEPELLVYVPGEGVQGLERGPAVWWFLQAPGHSHVYDTCMPLLWVALSLSAGCSFYSGDLVADVVFRVPGHLEENP